MKKLFNLFITLFIVISTILPISESIAWNFNSDSPLQIVKEVNSEANKHFSDRVQNTDLDVVTSLYDECDWISVGPEFSITRTLCSVKVHMRDYLQYVMFIWLTAATILLIRNGFKIVTAEDREKQMWAFKKNLLYIVIWVSLLIWFYYIIDIFVSVVNLISE